MRSFSSFIDTVKRYPKWKWIVAYILSSFIISEFLKVHYPMFKDVFFHGAASAFFIYNTFFVDTLGLNLETKTQKLIGAMMGGAFIWMFIESISKLFAKWAVWKFF